MWVYFDDAGYAFDHLFHHFQAAVLAPIGEPLGSMIARAFPESAVNGLSAFPGVVPVVRPGHNFRERVITWCRENGVEYPGDGLPHLPPGPPPSSIHEGPPSPYQGQSPGSPALQPAVNEGAGPSNWEPQPTSTTPLTYSELLERRRRHHQRGMWIRWKDAFGSDSPGP